MLFSHRVIKMAWAHRAQPPFHKEGALAHKALEEGGDGHGMKQKYCGYDGHVSQLFIFIHAGARSRRTRGRRGARSWTYRKRQTHRHGPRRPPLPPSSSSSCAWQSPGTYIPAMDEACSISLSAAIRNGPPIPREVHHIRHCLLPPTP